MTSTTYTHLANYLVNVDCYGYVVEPDSPNDEFLATLEIRGDKGSLTMAVAVGPEGAMGRDAFPLQLQADSIDDPADLPETLLDTDADRGKYWILDDLDAAGNVVGSSAYVWFGTSYRRVMFGQPGPPGPIPVITPSVELVNPATSTSSVSVTNADPYNPAMHFKIAAPVGPQGPAAALAVAPDVDFLTNAPEPGDILGYTGRRVNVGGVDRPLWVPVSVSQLMPGPFSMPESAFSSFSGISQAAAVGSFVIPPQPFPWTAIAWGHLAAWAVQLSKDPMAVGVQVLLGDPRAGTLIGRGFGNSLGEVNIMPHYSTPTRQGDAITPTNGRAVVPANHTNPAQGTVYVNLYLDGAIGLYDFSGDDAQIFLLILPVG